MSNRQKSAWNIRSTSTKAANACIILACRCVCSYRRRAGAEACSAPVMYCSCLHRKTARRNSAELGLKAGSEHSCTNKRNIY